MEDQEENNGTPSNSCNEMTEDDSEDVNSLARNWRALDVIEAIEHSKVGKDILLVVASSFKESDHFSS